MFVLAMDASKAQCFDKLQFFRLFVSCKKFFKTNVKLCWNKLRLILGIFIVTFLIMVLLSHLRKSSSLFFVSLLNEQNVVFFLI